MVQNRNWLLTIFLKVGNTIEVFSRGEERTPEERGFPLDISAKTEISARPEAP